MADVAGATAELRVEAETVIAPRVKPIWRRLLDAGAATLRWIVGVFEPLRKLVVNLGILAGIVIGGPAVYRLATKPTFVIKDIQVPGPLSDRGYTGDVIAQQILDHISEIDRLAGSKKEQAAISGFDLDSTMPSIQLPVGGFNLNAIVSEIRQLLGVSETKVTGEIYVAVPADDDKKTPPQYGVRLRIAGKGPLFKMEQPDASIEHLIEESAERVMHQFDPINLGYYFYRTKHYEKAYETTVSALADESDANDPWAYSMRGLIARDQGKYREAAANIRQAIDKDPKFWLGYVNLSEVLRLQGALDEAETAARKAIEMSPNEQEGHAALALVMLDRGQRDEALAEMKKGVAVDPKDAGGHLALGRILHKMERYEEAIASFSTSAELSDSAEPLISAAYSTKSLKRDDEAYALLRKATETDPKNSQAWSAYGGAALDRNDFKTAAGAYEEAIKLTPHDASGPLKLAGVYMKQKRTDQALAVLTKFAPGFRSDPDYLVGWSEALWGAGKRADAADRLKEAEGVAGANVDLFDRIARSLETNGEIAQAIDVYRRAIAVDPKLENVVAPYIARLTARLAAHSPQQPVSAAPAESASPPTSKMSTPSRPSSKPKAGAIAPDRRQAQQQAPAIIPAPANDPSGR